MTSSYSNKTNINPTEREEDEIDLKGIFSVLLRYKRSIGTIVLIITVLSAIYAFSKPNIYQADMSIEVQSSSKESSAMAMLNATLGMGGSSLDNEIAILQSRSVAIRALKNLSLGTQYFKEGTLRSVELYQNSPFIVKTRYLNENLMGKKIYITPLDESRYTLSVTPSLREKFPYWLSSLVTNVQEEKRPISIKEVYRFGETVSLPMMEIVISKTAPMDGGSYYVTIVPDELMFDAVRAGLSVAPAAQDAEILNLAYRDTIPERAEEVLKAIAQAYSDRNVDLKHRIALKKLEFIDEQIDAIDNSLAKSATHLKEYKTQNDVIDLSTKAKASINKIDELKAQRYELSMQESVLENLLSYLKNNTEIAGIDLSAVRSGGTSILSLIEKIQAANIERASLTVDFTENHPAVLKINQQIASLKANLKGTIESSLRGIRQRVATLDSIIDENEGVLANLPEEERQLSRLIGNFKFNEQVYQFLLQQRSETAIAEAAVVSDVRVIDTAFCYDVPVQPKRKLLVLVGVVLGLILGISQALLRDYLSNTIQTLRDVEKHTHLPIASILPYFKTRKTLYEEALRVLLTKFEFAETKPQVISISSSVRGEGRTTTAIELAQVIGQSGKKVVLLDMDMRQSAINQKLHLGEIGMSSVLSGEREFADVVHYVARNTDMVTSGKVLANPYGMIASEKFNQLLQELRQQYDYIILESPPAGLVADALVLMRLSDLNLMIFKAGYSKKSFVQNFDRFVKEHGLDNIAIVLNGMELSKIRPWRIK